MSGLVIFLDDRVFELTAQIRLYLSFPLSFSSSPLFPFFLHDDHPPNREHRRSRTRFKLTRAFIAALSSGKSPEDPESSRWNVPPCYCGSFGNDSELESLRALSQSLLLVFLLPPSLSRRLQGQSLSGYRLSPSAARLLLSRIGGIRGIIRIKMATARPEKSSR